MKKSTSLFLKEEREKIEIIRKKAFERGTKAGIKKGIEIGTTGGVAIATSATIAPVLISTGTAPAAISLIVATTTLAIPAVTIVGAGIGIYSLFRKNKG